MAGTTQSTIMQMTFELPRHLEGQYLKEALAAILYYNGTLTEKEARQMIGRTRREFEDEIIPQFGLSIRGVERNLTAFGEFRTISSENGSIVRYSVL